MTDEKSGEILENAAETAVSEESAKAPAKKAESKEPKKASKKPGVFKRFFSFCKEVKSEIVEVESLLEQVREKCWEDPAEDDTLYKLMSKTGNMLDETWTVATETYKNAWERLEESVDAFERLGQKIEGVFDDMFDKLKK